MKMQYLMLSILFVLAGVCAANAQKGVISSVKKESIPVWGECGMCKKKIEKAAVSAGATTANWNEDNKMLAVSYDRNKTSMTGIEQAIAAAGYDTKNKMAADEAYNKLPACCHYDRKAAATVSANCCDKGMACSKDAVCCKDGKCDQASKTCADMTACKEKGCCKS